VAAVLRIDQNTTVEIAPRISAEGQAAGLREDFELKLQDLTAYASKIAEGIKAGLSAVKPSEFSVELGFSAGIKKIWVLDAEGSIKLTVTWKG